jgi:hypothetical protein
MLARDAQLLEFSIRDDHYVRMRLGDRPRVVEDGSLAAFVGGAGNSGGAPPSLPPMARNEMSDYNQLSHGNAQWVASLVRLSMRTTT